MIEKTITYTNPLNGQPVSKTLYFHIYEEELLELYLTEGQAELPHKMKEVVENEDWAAVIRYFRRFINMSFGTRRGDEFIKSEKTTDNFTGTAAYNALFMELLTDAKAATEFFNGLFPAELMAKAEAVVKAQGGPEATLTNTELKIPPANGAQPGVGAGVPQPKMTTERMVELSGLPHPLGRGGDPLPWAFREPTGPEISNMTKPQLTECMNRKVSGWEPPESV